MIKCEKKTKKFFGIQLWEPHIAWLEWEQIHINKDAKQYLISRNIEKFSHNYDIKVREPSQEYFQILEQLQTASKLKKPQVENLSTTYMFLAGQP